MKKQIVKLALTLTVVLLSTVVFYSCKKDTNDDIIPGDKFSNTEMTNATFMGQIVKEDGTPLDGATVSTSSHMITTDADGFFYFSKISTPKNATLIMVEKAGYFKAFRTLKVIPNEDNQTRIMIMELPNPEVFTASTGGTVTISNGGSINFPANAIIDEVSGQPYTGSVNVYAKWIDPSSDDLSLLLPGDLRAINEDGEERGLATFGMQAVELFGSAGQKLQLGNGQNASVGFPIPASMLGSAPATIPLWHFDELQGMWVEDGEATLNGNEYKGSVSHFSYWNADIPTNGPPLGFTATFVDQNNNPLVGYFVDITPTNAIGGHAGSQTNSLGTVTGNVLPANTNFNLEVFDWAGCGYSTALHTQTFSSTTANVNLGTIVVTLNTSSSATISGTATDCNNNPLANGLVKIKRNWQVYTVTTNSIGQYSVVLNCVNAPTPVEITAFDVTNAVKGSSNHTITSGANNVGTLQACGTQFDFITVDITNPPATTPTTYSITEPTGSFTQYYQLETYIQGVDNSNPANILRNVGFGFDGPQTVAGIHNLTSYYDNIDSASTITPAIVNLTNYGAVGAKISGSFSTTVTGIFYTGATVNCNFRVTRQN